LASLQKSIEDISEPPALVHQRLDVQPMAPPGLLPDIGISMEKVDSIQSQLDRVTCLLFNMPDIMAMDVATKLAITKVREDLSSECSSTPLQPEPEESPIKLQGPGLCSKNNSHDEVNDKLIFNIFEEEPSDNTRRNLAATIHFDISDECSHADAEMSKLDPVANCEQFLVKLQEHLATVPLTERREVYERAIITDFDDVFLQFPRYPSIPTCITDKEFRKKYGAMHKTSLWRSITRKYHASTGDPMSKSDAFLQVMHRVVRFGDTLDNI